MSFTLLCFCLSIFNEAFSVFTKRILKEVSEVTETSEETLSSLGQVLWVPGPEHLRGGVFRSLNVTSGAPVLEGAQVTLPSFLLCPVKSCNSVHHVGPCPGDVYPGTGIKSQITAMASQQHL